MRRTVGAFAAIALALAVPSSAASLQDDDILQYVINSPPVEFWQVNGVQTPPRPRRAEGVLGSKAISVAARPSDQPWSTSARMPIAGAIKQGDTILLAVWARLAAPPPGQATSRLPLRVEQAAPPYTAIAQDNAEIGPDWKMVYASGVAAQDFEGGATSLSVHLATAAHTVELGPALVLNFGQNYDPAKLPTNTP